MINWGKRDDGNAIVNGWGHVAVKTETPQSAKLGSLLFGIRVYRDKRWDGQASCFENKRSRRPVWGWREWFPKNPLVQVFLTVIDKAVCVMNVATKDVVEASGLLQLWAGQKSRREATIHAIHTYIFEQMTLMPYCSSTPLRHSTHSTEQPHCTISGFCAL